MIAVVKAIFSVGPLLFGFGFMAPLIAQSLIALNVTPPLGLSPLMTGLIVGGLYGLVAQIRGRWV